MFQRSIAKIFALGAIAVLLRLPAGASPADTNTPAPGAFNLAQFHLVPGPNDGRIAYYTALLLETYHYSQHPFDTEMSERFFDAYLDSLDSQHENFLQSDLDEFAGYRTNLNNLTINDRRSADLTPAYRIFTRFLERSQQHAVYSDALLQRAKFKFTGEDRILLDRREAAYPKDLDAARQLWQQHLRYDYLQEKLSREFSRTNNLVMPLSKTDLEEITTSLQHRYDLNFQSLAKLESDVLLQFYLDSLAHAYDPHSDYLNAEHADDFKISMSLSLFGIGAQLERKDVYCVISSLVSGGPAQKSKQINKEDCIVAVAQSNQPPVNVVGMDLGKIVQLIRGPKGTEVRLTLTSAENPSLRHVVSLVRDEIKLIDKEANAQIIEMPDGQGGSNRLGLIELPSFYTPQPEDSSGGKHYTSSSTTPDVARLLKKLKQEKVAGVILDLRNNPGGSLEEAINLTGLFVPAGPVVQARNSDGQMAVDADDESGVLYTGPLIVLLNRFSASASEIVAGALQDYGRALLVGDISTHGKGTVQNLNLLRPLIRPATKSATNDPGQVKITIRKFYRISGASTQLKGVVPDIILPDVLNYSTQIGESALPNPLAYDTNAPVDYDKLNLVQPYLPELLSRTGARQATNLDFTYIREDIEQFKKTQADKTATLNEREALNELEAHQTALNAHERERHARKLPDRTIYDVTVENADQPGLTRQDPNTVAGNSPSAAKTNLTAVATKELPPTVIGNDAVEFQHAEEVRLAETEQILEDYISLLSSNRVLIAN